MLNLVNAHVSHQSIATQTSPHHHLSSIHNSILVDRPSRTRTFSLTRLFSASSATTELSDEQKTAIEASIQAKGDEIRALKDEGADKSAVAPLVEELLALKAQLDPSILKPKKKQNQQQQQKQKQQQPKQQQKGGSDEEESDFITARSVDYSKWYNDIIRVTGLAETSPVRGCSK